MEFMHRDTRPQPAQTADQASTLPTNIPAAVGGNGVKPKRNNLPPLGKWLRVASVALLFSITIMVLAIAGLFYFGNSSESKYIDSSKFQAVDIDVSGTSGSDQIYFGHIVRLNDNYLVLQNIYYITPNQSAQASTSTSTSTNNNSYTLVKAGCELVGAYDQMLINRDHVIFWENLKSSGTVATKIAQYQQQNPNGPDCSASSTSSTTPTTTTPSTTTKP